MLANGLVLVMARKKKFDNELQTLLLINITVIILILSFFNLINPKKTSVQVLGAEIETSYNDATYDDNTFWQEFIIKHPTYRDGWVELERMDKVKEIDPNFTP